MNKTETSYIAEPLAGTPVDDSLAADNIASDFTGTFGSRLVMLACALLISITTMRLLGPAGRGQFVMVGAFLEILLIVTALGMGQATVYYVGQGRDIKKIFTNSIIVAISMGTLSLLGVFALLPNISRTLSSVNPFFLLACGAVMPFQLLLFFSQHILLGEKRIKQYNRLRNLEVIVQLVLTLALVIGLGAGVTGAVIALITSSLAALAFALWQLARHIGWSFDPGLLKSATSFGLKSYVAEVAEWLTLRVDFFLVAAMTDLRQVGLYSAAVALAQVLWNVPFALATVVLSKSASSSSDTMDSITPRACRVILSVLFFLLLLLFLFGGLLIGALAGPAFRPAATPLRWLLPGIIAFSIHRMLNNDLVGRGLPEIGRTASTLSLMAAVALDLTLIPAYGISGAALAASISYGVGAAFVLLKYHRITGIPVTEILVPRFQDMEWVFSTGAGFVGRLIRKGPDHG